MADGDDRKPRATAATAVLSATGLAPILGSIVAFDGSGVRVDFPGNTAGPVPARSIVTLDGNVLRAAVESGRGVLLTFEAGDPSRPIILGLLADIAPAEAALGPTVATVDGQRVLIEGHDEIELRCGHASITLRRNGRVIIRGTYVETRASGVNRIKGGSVLIN